MKPRTWFVPRDLERVRGYVGVLSSADLHHPHPHSHGSPNPQPVHADYIQPAGIGASAMSDGYRFEIAVPWSDFGVTPAKGQVYGFAVSVSDNDNKTQNLQQILISNAPHRSLT